MELDMNFFSLGLNHRRTPVEIREKFTFDPAVSAKIFSGLKKKSLVKEALYLNTCNRAEVYAVAGKNLCAPDDLTNSLCSSADINPSFVKPFWDLKNGEDAVRHLFRVASSLDAMVIGETQILCQLKDAYFTARELKMTGPFINRALLRALNVAKKVRTETLISKGSVSVASVAVDLAERCLGKLCDTAILVIGTGEMGALVARQLKKHGAGKILIANRSQNKAAIIAEHTGGTAINWEDLAYGISMADIIVSSTASKTPVIDRHLLNHAIKLRKPGLKPPVFIDLGSPRNISKDCAKIPQINLFNIDDLRKIADENNRARKTEAKKAEDIVAGEAARFLAEISDLSPVGAIAMLNRKFEDLRSREIEKTFSKLTHLSPADREIIEAGTRSIISKILYDPVREIKDAGKCGFERRLISDFLTGLFRLKKE
jgi:glutamyl-tRNA reductase